MVETMRPDSVTTLRVVPPGGLDRGLIIGLLAILPH